MSQVPVTPRRPTQSTALAGGGPQPRISSSTGASHSSPHYITTRRHSLYGVEDRIIIDPGSRIWKVGFSGEGHPRDVFYTSSAVVGNRTEDSTGSPSASTGPAALWGLSRPSGKMEREEMDRMLALRVQSLLRSVFHNSLLTDPKARKIIIVEHPLLPMYIKHALIRTLFDNLQVPSVSFACSHLLSLCAIGRITGLVLDTGHLESVVLPIFAARPLFHNMKTTPLAGSRLSAHIRALLLMFGTYYPPPTSLMAAANIPRESRAARVPDEILTEAVIEQIKTRCVFVGPMLLSSNEQQDPYSSQDEQMSDFDMGHPPSSSDATPSEYSGYSQSNVSSSQNAMSLSELSLPIAHPNFGSTSSSLDPTTSRGVENPLQALEKLYKRHSSATDVSIPVPPLQQTGTGLGTLLVPGWIRERAAEVLFEGGDIDEGSLAETILDALLKVPLDLRRVMTSSILVTGGTAMLPGFTTRLFEELIRAIETVPSVRQERYQYHRRRGKLPPPVYDRYAPLRPLIKDFAILNAASPVPVPQSDRARSNAGKAPAFNAANMAWVGGSLAGSLKIGGIELSREKWDESTHSTSAGADAAEFANLDEDLKMVVDSHSKQPNASSVGQSIIPDWSNLTQQGRGSLIAAG